MDVWCSEFCNRNLKDESDPIQRAQRGRPKNLEKARGLYCLLPIRSQWMLPDTVLESRLDSAFFSRKTLTLMDLYGVEATVSVPFERFPVLKQMIAARRRWLPLDGERSYFESDWNPDSWSASYRFLFVRRKVRRQVKGSAATGSV